MATMTFDLRWQRNGTVGLVLTAAMLLGLTSCGDDDDTAQSDAAEEQDVCDARDELAVTIEMLEDVDVVEGGTDALEQALTDVRVATEDVADSAGEELSEEVGAVETAFEALEDAVGSLDQADSASAALESVSRSVADLAAAVGALGDELQDGCE